MFVDSHCHLDYPELSDDLDGVLIRAAEARVEHLLTISTKYSQFPQVLGTALKAANIHCTVGIHPHYADSEQVTVSQLIESSQAPKVVGLGETGLDYFYEHSDRKAQQERFITHIEAARETQLPLIIHTRDADDDTMDILEGEYKKGAFPGVIHCFSATKELAERAMDIGFYISISGIITFKKAEDLRETVSALPIDRFLIETDAPYLAPMPHRGKPNEPSFVQHTAAKLAEIKDVSVEELARVTTANFYSLFSKINKC